MTTTETICGEATEEKAKEQAKRKEKPDLGPSRVDSLKDKALSANKAERGKEEEERDGVFGFWFTLTLVPPRFGLG
jgi:hypothetical protein